MQGRSTVALPNGTNPIACLRTRCEKGKKKKKRSMMNGWLTDRVAPRQEQKTKSVHHIPSCCTREEEKGPDRYVSKGRLRKRRGFGEGLPSRPDHQRKSQSLIFCQHHFAACSTRTTPQITSLLFVGLAFTQWVKRTWVVQTRHRQQPTRPEEPTPRFRVLRALPLDASAAAAAAVEDASAREKRATDQSQKPCQPVVPAQPPGRCELMRRAALTMPHATDSE